MNKNFLDILIGIAVVVLIGAWFYSSNIQSGYSTPEEADHQAVLDRIRPVGQVVVEGAEIPQSTAADVTASAEPPAVVATATPETAAQPQPATAVDEAAPVVTAAAGAQIDTKLGEQTYASACFACHMTGAAGAPKVGDIEAWAPRIAQGMDVLHENSIKGFQGSVGVMPPKGGRLDLSDEAIKAAVAYMVAESGGS